MKKKSCLTKPKFLKFKFSQTKEKLFVEFFFQVGDMTVFSSDNFRKLDKGLNERLPFNIFIVEYFIRNIKWKMMKH